MEHQALYRKYRPRSFEDVCGQEHITSILRYESARGRLSHAYLFCGPRGTGKTTCAKILSKAVNCDSPVNGDPCGKCYKCTSIDDGSATDVVEMDAASNTGVEYIRDIRDEVTYTPAIMKKRVYIIDEVHMLSIGAFNALLKTLEEPPEHVVFILATTEQHKLPATIISRCQRFDFRRITLEDIASRLTYIADKENISLEAEAARIIAKQAQGGMRDAINLFELCAGGGHDVTAERVRTALGITGLENSHKCAVALKDGDFDSLFSAVANVVSSSKDVEVFWQELISFWRDMLVMKSTREFSSYLDLTGNEAELIGDAASRFTVAELVYHSTILDDALASMKRLPQLKRNIAELSLVKMGTPELESSTDALLARISALENKLKLLGNAPLRGAAELAGTSSVAAETEKAPEAAESEVKSPSTVDKVESSKPQAPSTPKADSVWREIADKSELMEKISAANPMIAGFFKTARCFVTKDGSKAVIRVANSFYAQMLSDRDSMQSITDALLLCEAVRSGCEIKIEVKETAESGSALMDEIEEL
ncbi:MAG: DNA polymerase III subunit gamma/tau [Clostridia bacterium]|nr:DNA polymerase III subunit gamma/tau [Clostridia bacterium]